MSSKWICALCLSGVATVTHASDRELALGLAGAVYNGAQRGAENLSAVVPLVHYESERLSVFFTTVSYHFLKSDQFQLSVLAAGRFDGYEPDDSVYLSGMARRRSGADAGLEAAWRDVRLAIVTDVTNASGGTEISLSYSRGFEVGKWLLRASAGLSWQDSKLASYYYGVDPSEQAVRVIDGQIWQRPAYETGDASTGRVGGMAIYSITKRWSALAGAETMFLSNEITDSPIVDKRYQWGMFAGIAYRF